MKKNLSVLIIISMILASIFGTSIPVFADPAPTWQDFAAAGFAGGDGSEDAPFEIETAAELAYLAEQVNAGEDYDGIYFVLTDDINLSANEWVPIGGISDNKFAGYFYGDGNTINGMHIGTAVLKNDSLQYAGLFGYTDTDSVIDYVSIDNAEIYSSYGDVGSPGPSGAHIGLLVGYSQGTVKDCEVDGTIVCGGSANVWMSVGGLVGSNNGSDIINSNSYANVTVGDCESALFAGGFVGYNSSGSIRDCSAKRAVMIGDLSDSESLGAVGGFVGYNMDLIYNCFAEGNVSGGQVINVGGFVGYMEVTETAEILNCFALGTVSGGNDANVGGFAGYAYQGTFMNCYAAGDTVGGTDAVVGGFNGDYDEATISLCYFNEDAAQTANGSVVTPADNPRKSDDLPLYPSPMDAAAMKNDTFKDTLSNSAVSMYEGGRLLPFLKWDRVDHIRNDFPFFSWESVVPEEELSEPSNLKAKAGDEEVLLSWDEVDGAEGYKVYVGTKSETYSQTLDADSNSYTVEDLINDTTYYFMVTAVDDSSESEESEEVKATTFHVAVLEDTTTRKAIATDNITVIVNSNGSYQLQLNPGVSGFYPNSGYQGSYFLFNKDDTTFVNFSDLSSTISDFQLSGNNISLKITDTANKLEHTISWEIIGSTSINSGGYMKLSVTSKNTDSSAHDLGTYMYWDTMINGDDGSAFTIIPNGWKNYSGNFEISGYFRNEDGTTTADAIFMGDYDSPSELEWDRETRMSWAEQEMALNDTINADDTAASVWYDPASVEAGGSRTVSCVFAVNSQTERINPITAQPGTVHQSTKLQIGVDPEDGASFKYKIFSSVPSIPALNTTASSITGLVDLVEGANITGVDATTNKYLGIYEVGADGNIKRFAAKRLFEDEIRIITAPTGGGGGGTSQPSQGTVIVIVNGEQQNAGTETKSTEAGKSVVTVTVDNKVIESRIDEAIKKNTTGNDNVIQVPVADTKSDVVKVELTGDIVKKLETNTFDVSIKRDNVEYVIPAEEFTISKVAENLGVQEKDLGNIKIEVKITKLDQTVVAKYNEVAKASGAELVFPPVSFEVVAKTLKADGTTGEVGINKFSNYVERVMEIPAGVDPSKITTGIVFNPDGTYSHVPTDVFQKDGKWYAKLNSLTNSDYSVIWNPITVKSVENHWAKNAVNNMASRLVIFDPEKFEPNKAITRADFAEYIVRALGLYREGFGHENKFKDVSASGDRTLAILIANEYGVITGYTDGTFKPDQNITREEAMVMYQRAMKVTKLTGSDTNRYQSYVDFSKVSGWAAENVKAVLSAHVFNGTSATTISPKANLTYAESAQAIKNLLVESKLINE